MPPFRAPAIGPRVRVLAGRALDHLEPSSRLGSFVERLDATYWTARARMFPWSERVDRAGRSVVAAVRRRLLGVHRELAVLAAFAAEHRQRPLIAIHADPRRAPLIDGLVGLGVAVVHADAVTRIDGTRCAVVARVFEALPDDALAALACPPRRALIVIAPDAVAARLVVDANVRGFVTMFAPSATDPRPSEISRFIRRNVHHVLLPSCGGAPRDVLARVGE